MNESPSGKVAVVTGAGRGLGQCVAEGLALFGARVAVVARSRDQVESTVEWIVRAGGSAWPFIADVANPRAVDELRNRVLAELGPAAIVVNAAGVFGPIQPVKDSDPDRWIETLAINTIGPYLVCRAFLPGMLAAGWGRIINFGSAASLHRPGPLNSAYGVSKVALNQFTRHLAAELAGTGVTANVIHPGEVKTAMWAAIRDESQTSGDAGAPYRAWAADVGRSGGDDPQKAVDLVLKLVGEQADPPNGQFLWIEGGLQTPLASW